jgi:capsular exopolysaccharide synthesis family protein
MEASIISDIRNQLAILHKRRALILTCLSVSLIAATVYNYTARPLYEAAVMILLDTDTPNLLNTRPVIERRRGIEALNTQFQILKGRELAKVVVEKLELQKNQELASGVPLSLLGRIQRRLVGPSEPEDYPSVAAFRSRLSVEPLPQSNLVRLRFMAYNPELAAKALNTLAQLYIEQTLQSSGDASSEAQGWLTQRLGEQKKVIGQSEDQLRQYEKQQGLVNLDERQRLAEQKLNTVHTALLSARTERLAKETTYRQMAAMPPELLQELPQVVASARVQTLKGKLADLERQRVKLESTLGEKHPEMIRVQSDIDDAKKQIAEAAQEVLRSAEAEYRMALKQEENLQGDLDPIQEELDDLRQKAVAHGVLKREAEADQQVLKNLINRSKETDLDSEMPFRNVRIIERAEVPTRPVSPQRARNYQLAIAIGLGLGLAITVLLEQMDDSIKTPDDVKQYLRQPFLGMVPDASRATRKRTPQSPLILGNPRSPLAEAYRVIRTNLIFSSAQGKCRSLMVSSVNPAEGKSTTVANLAASLAQNGAQVLVIDADLRRPALHKNFDVTSVPGLSDVIVGNCTLEQAIRKGVAKGIDVMPSGYIPPDPAELLGSNAMRDVVMRLRDAYEWLLVDAPPILTMADAPVLCPLVDGLLIVVAAERTARHAVLRSIEQISGVGGKVLGVVLNRVDLERNSYYFGRYYGDYYRSYYQDVANRRTDAVATGDDPMRRM